MMTVQDIKDAVKDTEYDYYGIRVDKIKYSVGDIANNSHQLLQDPDFDDNGELIYPYVGNGLYDAGELDGTSAIGFRPDDEESINFAINQIKHYFSIGDNIHIIAGDYAETGNDNGEVIVSDSVVLASISK